MSETEKKQLSNRMIVTGVVILFIVIGGIFGGYYLFGRPGAGTAPLPASTEMQPATVASPTLETSPIQLATPSPTPITLPDGKIVFTCQVFKNNDRNQICIINADGSGFKRLTRYDLADHLYASLSPDGQSVVFVSNRKGGNYEIYELELDEEKATQLTSNLGWLAAPEISPDGTQILFTNRSVNGRASIWLMNRDGSNPRWLYGTYQSEAWDPTWSPDGRQILFTSYVSPGIVQLFIINADGTGFKQLTSLDYMRGRSDWSPDGLTLATYAGQAWLREIFLISPDGSNVRQVTSGGNNQAPSFSTDGKWITYTSYVDNYGDQHGCEIYIMSLDGNSPIRLTYNDYCDWQPRWGP